MNISVNTQLAFNEGSLLAADHFRLLLDAMARPGRVFDVPLQQQEIGSLNSGAVMTLLALSDHETPVWLDSPLVDKVATDFLRFHCGCPIVDNANLSMFAVLPPLSNAFSRNAFPLGTPAYPDSAATLVLQVETLHENGPLSLSGPGIKAVNTLHVEGLDAEFWSWRSENNKSFPLGTDIILVTDDKLAALPRTTQVREIA